MRLFIALPVPVDVQDQLSALQDGLQTGRAVAPDQMHITLAFFADVPPQTLPDLDAALGDIRAYPFDVAFGGLDLFGAGKPRLLAAMIRPSPELDSLHRAVHGAARSAGLTAHRQKFRPHVTLIRFGSHPPRYLPDELQAYLSERATTPITGFVATRIALVQSTLGGPAPVYDELADYPFHPVPMLD